MPSSMELVIDGHPQYRALHTRRQKIDDPCAPSFGSKSGEEAGGEEQSSRCLNAHHGDAQTTDMLQAICRPYLRQVLDCGENRSHDAEEIGPAVEVLGHGNEENPRDDDNDEAV